MPQFERLVDMDDLFLRVFLSTKAAGRIKVGQEARIYPDAYPGESFDARVSKISDRAEFTPKNVETKEQRSKLVFEVRLKIAKNKDYKLKPGMTSDALIRIADDASWEKAKAR
ncbi:MAG: HlyD family efflux transporter periplasmic adaptor subunit [Armatimonadetes bacterium]|nr:HlyD family efflux transporter periplasmic adaptor subunit [Armatimonadota bacterium]